MKTCNGCKWAEWQKTASGKLHPSGEGRCTFVIKMPVLPMAFYYAGETNKREVPRPYGGEINRRRELRDHCPCFQKL